MGWWKMVISHLKHSYLNWKVNPCRKKNGCSFSSFFNTFWLSWFSFRLNRIFQVHDMKINFSVSCSFFSDLSTLGNDACHRWPSQLKASFLIWELFWKGWFLVRSCSYHLCLGKNMAQKYFREMDNFWSMCHGALIKVISKHHDLGTCVFGYWKGLASLKLWQVLMHNKLPIINFLQKLIIIFCCLIFEEFEKKFLNQELYGQLPEQAWSEYSFGFSKKCAPWSTKAFYSNGSKVKMSVC